MKAEDGSAGNSWGSYLESLGRLEAQEVRESLKSGKKEKSDWVGMVQSWADARHLDKEAGGSVGVADDLGDTE